jgi:hypothetical protein
MAGWHVTVCKCCMWKTGQNWCWLGRLGRTWLRKLKATAGHKANGRKIRIKDIAFARLHWLREGTSVLHYTYIAYLVSVYAMEEKVGLILIISRRISNDTRILRLIAASPGLMCRDQADNMKRLRWNHPLHETTGMVIIRHRKLTCRWSFPGGNRAAGNHALSVHFPTQDNKSVIDAVFSCSLVLSYWIPPSLATNTPPSSRQSLTG